MKGKVDGIKIYKGIRDEMAEQRREGIKYEIHE